MRALTCALLAAAALPACSDSSKAKIDAAPTGDSGPHDGAPDDGSTCEQPPALAACSTTTPGNRVTLRELPRLPAGAAMLVTSPTNDPRLFVVEQSGLIYVYENETRVAEPFLDISENIASGGEQGLLGLAFHPQYNCNGQFFVFYTTSNANVVARCTVSADPNVANETCTPILSVPDFAGNHNGGMIEFGSDGLLYIGTGDGGGGGDPQRTAQDPNDLLGKMLRIDVDNPSNGKMYGIPADNPFATSGGAPEIFMLGLRNPWRWSFDRGTGDLWIGDVGQREIEELNAVPAGAQVGKNFGWSIYEGSQCCATDATDLCDQQPPRYACNMNGLTFPQDERTHANGWISIIAGQTYRGTCHPDMVGWHYYTDYSGGARGLHRARLTLTGFETQPVQLTTGNFPGNISSIHADARGELFMTTTGGRIYHLQAAQ